MTNFHLVETTGNRPSVMAMDDAEHLIVGAYQHNNLWQFYVTQYFAAALGMPFVPNHLPLWTKDQAIHWIQTMATAYCKASELGSKAA